MWGAWSYDGRDSWRRVATEWFGSLGSERVGVEFEGVETVVGDEAAAVPAFVTFKGLSADGHQLRAMNNRLSWALRKRGGAWRIAHEHTSAPADFETAKVMLERHPSTG
jgi:ketosteroid isomerase-like protein